MHIRNFLHNTLLAISLIILPLSVLAMEKEKVVPTEQNETVTLESNDGRQFVVPRSLVKFAETVVDQLGEGLTGAVPIAASGKELEILIEFMKVIEKAERAINGKIIFIKIEPSIGDILKQKNGDLEQLMRFLELSNHLDIEALPNILAYFIAKQLSSNKEISEANLDDILRERFKLPIEMRRYIKKHYILVKAQCKEFTIADHLTLYAHPFYVWNGGIGITGCKITSLEGIAYLPDNIIYLDLANNCILDPITGVYDLKEPFKRFTKLRMLDLRQNQLRVLPSDFFVGLTQLWKIQLSSNRLTTVPADLFEDNPAVQTLTLDHNNLRDLPNEFVAKLEFLRKLTLEGNRFKCSKKEMRKKIGLNPEADLVWHRFYFQAPPGFRI